MVNGVTSGVLTRLDVLDNFPSIKICTAYETDDGRTLTTLPASSVVLGQVKPVYEEVEGWLRADERVRALGRPAGEGARLHPPHREADRHPDRHRLGGAGARPGDHRARRAEGEAAAIGAGRAAGSNER